MKEMKYSGNDVIFDQTVGFVKIDDLGDAQQIKVNTDKLGRVVAFLKTMRDMGFDETVITIQKGKPLILGGKEMGIGIAPIIDNE